MWAHMGPFQGLGGGTAAIRRSNQTTFTLTTLLVLARRWTWISTIKPETQFKEINMLSYRNGNLYP
jgi:hypothetical protein